MLLERKVTGLGRRSFIKTVLIFVPTAPKVVAQVAQHFAPASISNITLPIDPVMTDWAARVVTNGGTDPSAGTKTAVNAFVLGMKADGLWTKMKIVNVFAPDNLIASITPLLVGGANDPWTNTGAFVAGDLTVNGLVGNGSTKYLNTGFNPVAQFSSANLAGGSVYVYTTGSVLGWDFGGFGDTATDFFGFATNYTTSPTCQFMCFDAANPSPGVTTPGLAGFYSGNRIASNDARTFFANSTNAFAQVGATDTTHGPGNRPSIAGAPGTRGIRIFCVSASGTGNPFQFSNHRLSYVSFHDGLSSADAQAHYNRVQTLRTAFGGGFV